MQPAPGRWRQVEWEDEGKLSAQDGSADAPEQVWVENESIGGDEEGRSGARHIGESLAQVDEVGAVQSKGEGVPRDEYDPHVD